MTSISDYLNIKRLEAEAEQKGLKVVPSRHAGLLALIPAEGAFPIYSREFELVTGDVGFLLGFLRGWLIADNYYRLIGLVNPKKIDKAVSQIMQKRTYDKLSSKEDIKEN